MASIGNIKFISVGDGGSDRVLPVDGLPLALEAGRGVERRVTWTIEKRKINFGKACW